MNLFSKQCKYQSLFWSKTYRWKSSFIAFLKQIFLLNACSLWFLSQQWLYSCEVCLISTFANRNLRSSRVLPLFFWKLWLFLNWIVFWIFASILLGFLNRVSRFSIFSFHCLVSFRGGSFLFFALLLFKLGKLCPFFDNLCNFESLLLSSCFVTLVFFCFLLGFLFLALLSLQFLFLCKLLPSLYQHLHLLLCLLLFHLSFFRFSQIFFFLLLLLDLFPWQQLFFDLGEILFPGSFLFLLGYFFLHLCFQFSFSFLTNFLDLLFDEFFFISHALPERFGSLLLARI